MKSTRFPIPDLRSAALALRQPPAPMPEGVNITVVMAEPVPSKADCEEARRQRVEQVLRRPPRVIVTSRWTWEAPLGMETGSIYS